jgi:glutamate 5-kinase
MVTEYILWVHAGKKIMLCSSPANAEGFEKLSFPSRKALIDYMAVKIDEGYKVG